MNRQAVKLFFVALRSIFVILCYITFLQGDTKETQRYFIKTRFLSQ